MLTKNQTLTCRVEGLGANGEGICRHDGQVVFVPFSLPGEEIVLRVQKTGKSHGYGKVLDVLVPSPSRVQPPCPYFFRCGGCSVQHMDYDSQLDFKKRQVADCLSRMGGIRQPVNPVIGMDHPWKYRNKTAMPVAATADGPAAGYYAPRSHRLVPVTSCLIAHQTSDAAADCVIRWMKRFEVSSYDERSKDGLVRHIITRTSRLGQVMVTLSVNGRSIPHQNELSEMLQEALPAFTSLCLTAQEEGDNVILGDDYQALVGSGRLTEQISGLEFDFSPLSFSQVNLEVCEKMYAHAIKEADVRPGDCLADLYCGAGAISLLAAKSSARVIGIELSPSAIHDAKANAERNGTGNARFLEGRVEAVLPELVRPGKLKVDVVLLDPPRKGAHPDALDAIGQAAPRKIVYISCHPASQARDAAILCGFGYRVVSAQPFDMFCQTSEIENVLAFERIDRENKDE